MSAKILNQQKCAQQKCDTNFVAAVDRMTSRDFHRDVHAHVDVIGQLLKDQAHWRMYRDAIIYNKHLFQGHTVLHIGCSVGLLSLFAAQAGAKRVFAVDASNAADYARRVVQSNNWAHVVEVFKTRIENLRLPVKQVDVIVCDWPGYSLLFQSLCGTVIYARDKWLRPGGVIFPDIARLHVAALTDPQHKRCRIDWWLDVYGFNMQAMRAFALKEPRYKQVPAEQVMSSQYLLHTLNLNTATAEDLKFRSKFMLRMQRDGCVDGLVTYFQFSFSKSHTPINISTAPNAPLTRWMQTAFYFDQSLRVTVGSVYCGGFEMYAKDGIALNQMEVGLELFSGNIKNGLHLELETRWQLQPNVLPLTEDLEEAKEIVAVDAAKVVKEQPQQEANDSLNNERIWHGRGGKKQSRAKHDSTNSCQLQSVLPNASHKPRNTMTITIGDVTYPCHGERAHTHNKKGKRTKKG